MKTSEKPRMKASEWMIVRRRTRGTALSDVSSSNETPVMKVMYEGTSGSTQGEMKETTPARKAARSETWLTCDSNTERSAREQRLDRLLEGLRRQDAQELLHDPSLTIQDEGRGDCVHAAVETRGAVIREQHRVVDVVLPGKGRHHALAVRVQRQAHDRETLVLVLALEPHEFRNLRAAGPAPGRPEVQDHHLALEVGEADLLPGEIGQLEVRRVRSDLAGIGHGLSLALFRFRVRAAEGQQQRQRGQELSLRGP